jgi:ketosteroid isomerase-like protein
LKSYHWNQRGPTAISTPKRAGRGLLATVFRSFCHVICARFEPIDGAGGALDGEVAELFRRTAEANAAWMRGDMRRYAALITHADDYTLMAPFGGAPTRGFDRSPERLAELARYFRAGTSAVELVQCCATDGLVVLVTIERQRGGVGGLPEQDWSLRVTQVYRRDGSE